MWFRIVLRPEPEGGCTGFVPSLPGLIEMQNANVRWFLSGDGSELPDSAWAVGRTTFRSMMVDGEEIEFGDLHARVYEQTLAADGDGIADARPSIELVRRIRTTTPCGGPRRPVPAKLGRSA